MATRLGVCVGASASRRRCRATTVRGRVESLIVPILHTGEFGMQRVARTMGVSRPTLYRHLKSEGVSFETLLDDLLCSPDGRRRLREAMLDVVVDKSGDIGRDESDLGARTPDEGIGNL
mgnify:CR=1 FL=1